jgi:predicted ribosomally synthesized peptide with nif11-like leader
MQQSVEMLLKKMSEDKAFAEKILSQTENEKVIEIAKGEGIEFTMEGIDEANEIIAKALQPKNEGELDEEDLEKVAGGSELLLTISLVSASVSLISTSASVISGIVSVEATSALTIVTSATLSGTITMLSMNTVKKK